MELKPGDTCEIVRTPYDSAIDRIRLRGIKTVVLIGIDNSALASHQHKYEPFWRVTGLPPGVTVSHLALQKFPDPPPLTVDDLEHIPVLTEVYW